MISPTRLGKIQFTIQETMLFTVVTTIGYGVVTNAGWEVGVLLLLVIAALISTYTRGSHGVLIIGMLLLLFMVLALIGQAAPSSCCTGGLMNCR